MTDEGKNLTESKRDNRNGFLYKGNMKKLLCYHE